MKIIMMAALLAGNTVNAGAAEEDQEPVRRIEVLQWRKGELSLTKDELVRRVLAERHVSRLPVLEAPPLVAYERPDGTVEIRHAPATQGRQAPDAEGAGVQK